MRRIVALIMTVAVLFVSSAYAESLVIEENFSIRNGISFGMNADEIQQIEMANGNKLPTEDNGFAFLFPCDVEYITRLSGASCNILYYLDENDILSGFKYVIFERDTYNSIRDSLSIKYGKANSAEMSPFETKCLSVASKYLYTNPTVTQYDWWLVQYQDCFVCIEASTLKTDVVPLYRVDYTILSYDEVATVLLVQDLIEQDSRKTLEEGL